MLLFENSQNIFEKIEPKLIAIAKKYRVTDPSGEARSWYMEFTDILKAFDSGRYIKQYVDASGNTNVLSEQPTPEEVVRFEKSLFAYIKTAFKHHLFLFYRKDKKLRNYIVARQLETKSLTTPTHEKFEIITLSDMIEIIAFDLKRATSAASVVRDDVNKIFLQAIFNYHTELRNKFGDFPIVKELNSDNPREFFVYDIREGRTDGIRNSILELLKAETNRAVILTYGKLTAETGYFALNRKISRYFNDHLKGMPERLREMKNKKRLKL